MENLMTQRGVLRARGITLSDAGRARVEACSDTTTMDRWVARAVTISREADLFAEDSSQESTMPCALDESPRAA